MQLLHNYHSNINSIVKLNTINTIRFQKYSHSVQVRGTESETPKSTFKGSVTNRGPDGAKNETNFDCHSYHLLCEYYYGSFP